MEVKKTERGFSVIKFVDRYGKASSLQKSSLAFENTVWLGCDDIEVNYFVPGKGLDGCGVGGNLSSSARHRREQSDALDARNGSRLASAPATICDDGVS